MTDKPWSELTAREKDARVARALGWTDVDFDDHDDYAVAPGEQWISRIASPFQKIPAYTTDLTAARLVEDEIERRGYSLQYISELCEICGIIGLPSNRQDAWELIRATPDQRCEAAVRALGG